MNATQTTTACRIERWELTAGWVPLYWCRPEHATQAALDMAAIWQTRCRAVDVETGNVLAEAGATGAGAVLVQ